MPTLPSELVRATARTAHPETTRKIKRLNHSTTTLITQNDLIFAEARWRVHEKSPKDCLKWAAGNGHTDILSLLLNDCFTPERYSVAYLTRSMNNALSLAAHCGHVDIVALLLASNADIQFNLDHALTSAAGSGHIGVVSLLLEKGANVNGQNGRGEPLFEAAENGDHEMVALLLDAGATANASRDLPLEMAAQNGHGLVVALLLRDGPEEHILDNALTRAFEMGHAEMVSQLLAAGSGTGQVGNLVLEGAARDGDMEKLVLAKSLGIPFPPRALCYAAAEGHRDAVSLILDAGVSLENEFGELALGVARQMGFAEIEELLVEAGVWVP